MADLNWIDDLTTGGSLEARSAISGIDDIDERLRIVRQFHPSAEPTDEFADQHPGLAGNFIFEIEPGRTALFDPIGPDKGDVADLGQMGAELVGGGIGSSLGALGYALPPPVGPIVGTIGTLVGGVLGSETGRQAHEDIHDMRLEEPRARSYGERLADHVPDMAWEGAAEGVGQLIGRKMGIVREPLRRLFSPTGKGGAALDENIGRMKSLDSVLQELRAKNPEARTDDIGILDAKGRAQVPTIGTGMQNNLVLTLESGLRQGLGSVDVMRKAYDDYFKMGENAARELSTGTYEFKRRQAQELVQSGIPQFDNLAAENITKLHDNPIDFITDPESAFFFTSAVDEAKNIGANISPEVQKLYDILAIDPPPLPAGNISREAGDIGDNIVTHGLEQMELRNQKMSAYLYGIADSLSPGATASLPNTKQLANRINQNMMRFQNITGDISGDAFTRVSRTLEDARIYNWTNPITGDAIYGTANDVVDQGFDPRTLDKAPTFDIFGREEILYNLPLKKLQELRTFTRQQYMKSGDIESLRDKELLGVYNSLTADIEDALKNIQTWDVNTQSFVNTPDAYNAWKKANDYYAEWQNPNISLGGRSGFQKQNYGESLLDALKNKSTGESVYNFVMQGTKSGAGNLPDVLNLLPYPHQESLKGSIRWSLGWNKQQWSPRTWITNTNPGNLSTAARGILFSPTVDGIDRMVGFENMRDFLKNMNISDAFLNTSGTGFSVQNGIMFLMGAGGTAYGEGGLSTGAMMAGGYMAASNAAARITSNKRLMNFLGRKMRPQNLNKEGAIAQMITQAIAIFGKDPQMQDALRGLGEAMIPGEAEASQPFLRIPEDADLSNIGVLTTRQRREQLGPEQFQSGIGELIAP